MVSGLGINDRRRNAVRNSAVWQDISFPKVVDVHDYVFNKMTSSWLVYEIQFNTVLVFAIEHF